MRLYLGDCLEIMKELPDNSVDSVVTDPPYGLGFMGKQWDIFDKTQFGQAGLEGENDLKVKKRFNILPRIGEGQALYDFCLLWATECLRVLKPGGHLLSFGGTRTYHRMTCAVEDAGLEIRDCIFWVYGSGFPKSLNIGKAVDKLQGNEREEWEEKRNGGGLVKGQAYGGGFTQKSGIRLASKGTSEWEGWGTSLKPAVEPIVLARKPLSEKTVAENVLKWGTGGLNIDGCRISLNGERQPEGSAKRIYKNNQYALDGKYGNNKMTPILGRFPANLIHDGSEEVVGMFPQSRGMASQTDTKDTPSNYFGLDKHAGWRFGRGDNGSAARFFYCAKASKAERNRGLEGFDKKPNNTYGDYKGTPNHTPKVNVLKQNNHPTVKPISLMRYLCRLVTPPGGVVLDPFMGSGSTGTAAKMEGFDFIGIEKDEGYFKIAEARIREAKLQDYQISLLPSIVGMK